MGRRSNAVRGDVSNDIAHPPIDPQFQMGATSSEAEIAEEIADNPIGGPGEIVKRLGRQFELPRAQPDVGMSQRPGINVGES